jgi:predicted lysophospholipase L1 biosynthesis ABC-type transport system permease subunit
VRSGPGVLGFTYTASAEVSATLDPVGPDGTTGRSDAPNAPIPAVATPAYLTAVGAKVGDVLPLSIGAAAVDMRVTAAVDAIPTAGDNAVVVDLATLTRRLAATGAACPEPTEWWLPAASPQDRTPVLAAAALRHGEGTQNLQLQQEVATQLTDDPLSAGPQVTLIALAVVAAILAAIGFAAATAAAASERAREHAILHALGCPPRRLARTAAAEPALLIALGAAVGLAVGALMVRLVVPLVVLTPSAQRPVPPVVVTLPPGPTLALVAAIAAVPVLTAFLSGRRSAAARPRPLEEL